MSIPTDVIPFIIQELNFDKLFSEFIKISCMDVEEFNEYLYKIFRIIPFPTPHYDVITLLRSYNRLCDLRFTNDYFRLIESNTRLGDILIYHFHPSIWDIKCNGKMSPYEAWNDDKTLKELIRDRVLYQYTNPNKILQGFNVSDIAPAINFISAAQWKLILCKYWPYDEINTIDNDPAILLASISLKKKCIGKFNNETLEMKSFLETYGIDCDVREDGSDNIVAHLRNDEEMNMILNKYKCEHYLFILDDSKRTNDVFHVRSHKDNAYYCIKNKEGL